MAGLLGGTACRELSARVTAHNGSNGLRRIPGRIGVKPPAPQSQPANSTAIPSVNQAAEQAALNRGFTQLRVEYKIHLTRGDGRQNVPEGQKRQKPALKPLQRGFNLHERDFVFYYYSRLMGNQYGGSPARLKEGLAGQDCGFTGI